MALCVECIGPGFYSLAHYGLQNGDPMRDPDVIVWRGPDENFYPVAFRNDYQGIDREYVEFEGGKPVRIAPRAQADLASFCGTWMQNLKRQQEIGRPDRTVVNNMSDAPGATAAHYADPYRSDAQTVDLTVAHGE